MRTSRFAPIAAGAAAAAMLAACGANPTVPLSGPVSTYPSTYPSTASTAPASLEYGRVTNIESYQGGTASSGINVPGAIMGAVAGAVLGHQIGSGSGRDAATVLGGAAGAALGSQVGKPSTATTGPIFRVSIQTDQGVMRVYDVPATGELRVGDRVRVENGVIYRS
jgi:outer membrane lipoprotein SlyB